MDRNKLLCKTLWAVGSRHFGDPSRENALQMSDTSGNFIVIFLQKYVIIISGCQKTVKDETWL